MNAVSEDCNPVCSPNDEAAQSMAVNNTSPNWDFQVPKVLSSAAFESKSFGISFEIGL